MIEAVVFDLGGVLIDVDSQRALRELRRHCTEAGGFEPEPARTTELLRAFECGELTTPAFHEAVCRHERLSVDFARFCTAYCDIFSPVRPMIEAHAALRATGLATYVFSNTSALHFDHIRRSYPFMGEFSGHALSYELGCMKPDARAYAAVERMTGRDGDALVYIDDRPENVEAGARRGWQTIHHTSPSLTVAALRRMGFL